MGLKRLLSVVADCTVKRIPTDARVCLKLLMRQLTVKAQVVEHDRRVHGSARAT